MRFSVLMTPRDFCRETPVATSLGWFYLQRVGMGLLLTAGRHVVLPTAGRHVVLSTAGRHVLYPQRVAGRHAVLPTAGRHMVLLTAGRQAAG